MSWPKLSAVVLLSCAIMEPLLFNKVEPCTDTTEAIAPGRTTGCGMVDVVLVDVGGATELNVIMRTSPAASAPLRGVGA